MGSWGGEGGREETGLKIVCLQPCLTETYLDGFITKVNCLKEGLCNREQSLPWPFCEPVDGTAVDQRWEHTAARTEGISHWAHAEHDVQTVLNSPNEMAEDTIPSGETGRGATINFHL